MKKYGALLCLFVPMLSWSMNRAWEEVTVPSEGESNSIGSYANGCLAGGAELAPTGTGYQVIRTQRNRYYGHVDMIDYLTSLAIQVDGLGIGRILVGDIAMPRGGRFASGHASHQTGLDADIWLRLPDEPLSPEQLSTPKAYSVVDLKSYQIEKEKWTDSHALLIQTAAVDERVARIFVHPVIKQQLCDTEWTDRDWLRKVRPWWGHYSHFHVRLHCPEGDTQCVEQSPPPKGDGCGAELASWKPNPYVAPKPKAKVAKTLETPKKKPAKPKYSECVALLNQQ
ncbi:penicillin-insensitive murein endopeptidase [Vibrio sp. 10N.286.49.C2]|uniref:penicillin-insensitive murein endopeptidase n=1 Tax=unclassified Vibrio TaxID=2614977 RepID=UPI000C83E99F|nr:MULTISPECIES: penicillin-insensitive murein endopeptidase [unclassified Vibrio]PMH43341.1 penicillin-insensitive murein endopeptidase [Vibrio sp. 10N.286.49.C2]PMH56993.1 penicillin-insensitive murein endopeptidase [Vibrio sp. 10N.286.49.B1]PMH79129.1 penicillin-insensitive murein endopeptidase [Vibrio sp. 10N.286.48.B7]